MKNKLTILLLLLSNIAYSQIEPNQPEGTDFGYALSELATAGELLVYGDLCYFGADGRIWKADADLDSMANRLLCIVREDTLFIGYQGKVLLNGKYVTSGLTPKTKYYVSITPGAFTSTAPAYPAIRKFIGYSIDDKVLYFLPTFSEDDYLAFADTINQVRDKSKQTITGIKNFDTPVNQYITLVSGAELESGDLCYFGSSGQMLPVLADHDSSSKGLLGIAMESLTPDQPGKFLIQGQYELSENLLTMGSTYYIDPMNPGKWTENKPVDPGDVVRIIGYALTDQILIFIPDATITQI